MSKRLESLRSRLNEIEERRAAAQARSLQLAEKDDDTTDESEAEELRSAVKEFHDLAPEADNLRNEIAALEAVLNAPVQAREASLSVHVAASKHQSMRMGVEFGAPSEVRSAALRAAEEEMVEVVDSQREQIADVIRRLDTDDAKLSRHVIAHSRPEYRSAFHKSFRAAMRGLTPNLTEAEHQAMEYARSVTITSGSAGTAIPTPLDPSIILTGAHSGSTNPWRRVCRNLQTLSNTWNGVSSAGITVGYGAEAEEATDNSPTLGTKSITCYRGRGLIPFSMEADQDWSGMQSEMLNLLRVAKDDKDEAVFTAISAAAANTPSGFPYLLVTNHTGQIVASAGANTFAVADVHALHDALPDRFEMGAAWMAAKATYSKIRQFDTSGGAGLWAYLANGLPSTLLEYPHYTSPSLDSSYGSGENYILFLGDYSQAFGIADRLGTTIELIPHLFGGSNNFPTGERGLFMNWRTGTGVLNQSAVVVLNIT